MRWNPGSSLRSREANDAVERRAGSAAPIQLARRSWLSVPRTRAAFLVGRYSGVVRA
jgi:hypothetical protein